jgi:hypothetical protein
MTEFRVFKPFAGLSGNDEFSALPVSYIYVIDVLRQRMPVTCLDLELLSEPVLGSSECFVQSACKSFSVLDIRRV